MAHGQSVPSKLTYTFTSIIKLLSKYITQVPLSLRYNGEVLKHILKRKDNPKGWGRGETSFLFFSTCKEQRTQSHVYLTKLLNTVLQILLQILQLQGWKTENARKVAASALTAVPSREWQGQQVSTGLFFHNVCIY